MASPNINLRDPVMYRGRNATHHRTGNQWCIYPMYSWAHPVEDTLEGITHSVCTLEFEDQRPFYDWILARLAELGKLARPLPRQYRSEDHTSELQSLLRISYAIFCLKQTTSFTSSPHICHSSQHLNL